MFTKATHCEKSLESTPGAQDDHVVPARISYSTSPKAKMSVRASASRPCNCSGEMCCKVPRRVPSWVSSRTTVSSLAAGAGIYLGGPEIQQLDTGLGHHDVGGLQVPVYDALPMCGIERFRNRHSQP